MSAVLFQYLGVLFTRRRFHDAVLNAFPAKTSSLEQGQTARPEATPETQGGLGLRARLQMAHKTRDLAMFNLAIDSKLRRCDLAKLQVRDVARGTQILKRAMILQQKTHQPVQFELTVQTREALSTWIQQADLGYEDYLFNSRRKLAEHISTRQYARIVSGWVASIGLDPAEYGTHSIRRTKVSLIYRKTKNLRAVQLLLGHRKLESTVRYLGIEVDDALEIAEQTDI